MFNIVKMQDLLKNLPDDKLAQLAMDPTGMVPPYLVISEKQRRDKMREEFSGKEPPKNTVAEEMFGSAAPEMPQGGPPPGGPPQGAPEGPEANAQGLMGLPDQTMAGNAMRAMISGQPQQVDGMTVMPPQGMAAGGAVQFVSPFSNGAPQAQGQYAGYAPVQSYNPKPYTPPKDDYSDFRHQFDGRGTPHTPNPRVHTVTDADRYGLPKGMSAPTPGTQGLGVRYASSNERAKPQYYWQSPEARDAYIRYMTPPAKTATAAPATGASAPVAKAGGGPIYAAGGMYAMPYSPAADPYGMMSPEDLIKAATSSDPSVKEPARAEMDRRNQQNRIERIGGSIQRGAVGAIKEIPNVAPWLLAPIPTALKRGGEKAIEYLTEPAPPIQIPGLAGRDIPGAAEAISKYIPPSAESGLAPEDDVGKGTNAPELPQATEQLRRRSPLSAPVSGEPDKAADKGIASLPQGPKGMTYEDYMRQANELINSGRGDPEEARRNSINTALMQLGLGMATSKSASPLAAIAEGGIPALQGFTEAEAQRRKDDRALVGERLATLGVGAQMSQAEAKAADERAYRAEQAAIQREQLDVSREEARLNAAYRERDNELKKMQVDAQIWANKNPDKIIEWKARFGEERGVEIGSQYEALTDLATLYNKQYEDASRLAQQTQNADDIAAAKKVFDKLTATADDIRALSRFGRPQQASVEPTKPPPSEFLIPGTR